MSLDAALLGAACLAAFLLRLLFSFFSAPDTRGVFWRLERLKPRRWVHYELDDCAVPAVHGYPVLFHWLIARFPRRWWVVAGYLVNAAVDLPIAVALYVVCSRAAAGWPGLTETARAAVPVAAAAVFLFTPALLPTNARMMAFNGRAFGLLLFTAYALLVHRYAAHGSWVALAGAGAIILLIVLSSQFTFQAVVAATVGLAVAERSWPIAALLPASLAIGALPRRLGLREPLRYFGGLYRWQFRQRRTGTMAAARSQWIATAWRHLRRGRWRALWQVVMTASPPVLAALAAPPVLVVLWFAAAAALGRAAPVGELAGAPFARFCLALTLTFVAATLLTSFSPFSIFGQAERYLEYAAPFAAVLAVAFLGVATPDPIRAVAILLAVGVALCLFNALESGRRYGLLFGGRNALLSTEQASYHGWLDRLRRAAPVLPVPLHRCKSISASCRRNGANPVRLLYDWLSVDGEPALAYMSRCMAGQTYTPSGFRDILAAYDFDAALVFKDETTVWVDGRRERDWRALVAALDEPWAVVEEDERYALVARRDRLVAAADPGAREDAP